VQGDAGREITAFMGSIHMGQNVTGMAYPVAFSGGFSGDPSATRLYTVYVATSRVVPTDAENRPVNTAVRYLIRALP
jgi:hypothetical protein